MIETVFDVDGVPGGLGSLVRFRLQVAPTKTANQFQSSPLDRMRFSQEDPGTYTVSMFHMGGLQNQIAG